MCAGMCFTTRCARDTETRRAEGEEVVGFRFRPTGQTRSPPTSFSFGGHRARDHAHRAWPFRIAPPASNPKTIWRICQAVIAAWRIRRISVCFFLPWRAVALAKAAPCLRELRGKVPSGFRSFWTTQNSAAVFPSAEVTGSHSGLPHHEAHEEHEGGENCRSARAETNPFEKRFFSDSFP